MLLLPPPTASVQVRRVGEGRGMFTTVAVEKGAELVRCRPLAAVVGKQLWDTHCHQCMAAPSKPARCHACGVAVYCDRECQKQAWREHHRAECAMLKKLRPAVAAFNETHLCAVRVLRRLFESPRRRLHEFDDLELFESLLAHPALPGTPALETEQRDATVIAMLLNTDSARLGIQPDDVFATLRRLNVNCHTIYDAEFTSLGWGCYPFIAMINHACVANCVVTYRGDELVLRSLVPLDAGAEVTVAYVEAAEPTALRRRTLWQRYRFFCDCARCCDVEHDRQLASIFCPRCAPRHELMQLRPAGRVDEAEALVCSRCSFVLKSGSPDDVTLEISAVYRAAADELPRADTPDAVLAIEQRVKQLSQRFSDVLPPHHLVRRLVVELLRETAIKRQGFDAALEYSRVLTELYEFAYGPAHPILGVHLMAQGKLASLLERDAEARACFARAIAILAVSHGAEHPLVLEARGRLAECS